MTVYRDSQKKQRPMICCVHSDVTYVTNKNWEMLVELRKEGRIETTRKVIFFDSVKELEQFVQDNCKVLIYKMK